MNNDTDKILYRAGSDTETISIVNDNSLTAADMEAIAEKIRSCTKLRSLTLTSCGLSSDEMGVIAEAVAQHETLSSLNFSNNTFKDLDFLEVMINGNSSVMGNPHIREIDIMGCEKEGGEWRSWADFFQKALELDNLVTLKIEDDPWNYYAAGFYFFKDPQAVLNQAVNLVNFPLEKWSPTNAKDTDGNRYVKYKADNKRIWMADHCKQNRTDAEHLFDRVKEAHIITASDIADINKRLPVILYLGEQTVGRDQTIELLRNFYDRAQATPGLAVDLEKFQTHVPKREAAPSTPQVSAAAPPVQPQTELPKTYNIAEILAALPPFDETKIRQQIEDCIDHPSNLQNLGKPEITAAANITAAALHIMASMPTTEKVETAMTGFLGKLQEAHVLTEALIGKNIPMKIEHVTDPLLPAWPERHKNKGGFLSFLGVVHKDTLTDAAKRVGEANGFLSVAQNEIGTLGRDIVSQIEATETVSGAYIKVEQRIEQIIDLGNRIIAEKKAELSASDKPVLDVIVAQTSAHLDQLHTRLDFLSQTANRIKENLAPYTVHASLVQKHGERISELAEQHFPLLIEEVNILTSHLQSSVPGSDQRQSAVRQNANTGAAQQTFQTIDGIVTDILTLFRTADDGASEIRGHIGKLLPTRALTQTATACSPEALRPDTRQATGSFADRPSARPSY